MVERAAVILAFFTNPPNATQITISWFQKELKPGNMAKSFWNAQPTGHQLHTSLGSKMESLISWLIET